MSLGSFPLGGAPLGGDEEAPAGGGVTTTYTLTAASFGASGLPLTYTLTSSSEPDTTGVQVGVPGENYALIAHPNYTDAATLSGGDYEASLPLTRLQERALGRVARSSDLTTTATQFDIDLGRDRNIRLIALANHNLSLNATYRLRISNVSDFSSTEYDTGATFAEVWPPVYPSDELEWEDDNFWTGNYTTEELQGSPWTFIHLLDANVLARYIRIEFDDGDNPDGFVEYGRLFVGPVWQPIYGASYQNAELDRESRSEVSEARSGAEFFAKRPSYRVIRLTIPVMETKEAMARAYELMRRADTTEEVVAVWDPTDTVHAIRRRFLGRLRKPDPIRNYDFNKHSVTIEVKELLP